MKIRVKLFAALGDAAGQDQVVVTLPAGATVADLRAALAEQYPSLSAWLPRVVIAVDRDYAVDARPLDEQQEVACIPPVSGG